MPKLPPRLEAVADRMSRRMVQHLNRCKPWHGTIDADGYPRVRKDGRQQYAHRVAFEEEWRALEPGERVYRLCGERDCVNPYHLTTERPEPKGKGKRPASAKLTARKARTIRKLWSREGRPTQQELADEYGVGRSAISLVVRGLTWKDV